jgi:hypothetical protein
MTDGDGINKAAVDRFTAGHFLTGWLLGRMGFSRTTTAAIAIGWEIAEGPLKAAAPGLFPHPSQDSLQNAALDATAAMVGFEVATSR